MRDLVDTTEMYLRTIYELEEEGIIPLRARIVERLEQSGPTVSQTVARMERDGLLKVRSDRSLQLTDEGRTLATAVMRKHRIAERLLTDILKLDIHKVHDEACRWEHVMSDEVERRAFEVLGQPQRSPFGNPIPGLTELGVQDDADNLDKGVRAVDLPEGKEIRATVVQLNEILQVDARQFRAFHDANIRPGTEITVFNDEGYISIIHNGKTIELSEELGHALRVSVVD